MQLPSGDTAPFEHFDKEGQYVIQEQGKEDGDAEEQNNPLVLAHEQPPQNKHRTHAHFFLAPLGP